MMWSTDLHTAALLEEYVAPQPKVADHTREQLLCEKEKEKIQRAISDGQGLTLSPTHSLYGTWIAYSGLDLVAGHPSVKEAIEDGDLLRALFDLGLGQRAKNSTLSSYTEIHAARASIRSFFILFGEHMSSAVNPDRLWWDEIQSHQAIHKSWISTRLKQDRRLLPIFEGWLKDSEHLQSWLENFEADTLLVNNPQDEGRFFSESTAIMLLGWAEVRPLSIVPPG